MSYAYTGPMPKDSTDTHFRPKKDIMEYVAANVRLGGTVLDYGAGRYARNAVGLREAGYRVYAYDPLKGDGDGWKGVSPELPCGKFDLVFSSYVLNVVRQDVEREIVEECRKFGPDVHWTRGRDIFNIAKKAIRGREGVVVDFFLGEFAAGHPTAKAEYDGREVSDETIMEFSRHGFRTTRGFQRIPSPAGYERSGSSVLFFK
jgi:hypothetical protein